MATFKQYGDDDDDRLEKGGQAEQAPLVGQGSSEGTAETDKAKDYTRSNFVSGRKVLQANQGAGSQPDLSQGFVSATQKRLDDLKSGAADYSESLKGWEGDYTVDEDTVDRGVAGDDEGWAKVNRSLMGPTAGPATWNEQAGVNVRDANALNTRAGIEDAMRQRMAEQGNYSYGSGASSLDSLLFQRSGAAGDQSRAMIEAKAGLEGQADEIKSQADLDREAAERRVKEAQDWLKSTLTGKMGDITQSGQQRGQSQADQSRSEEARAAAFQRFAGSARSLADTYIQTIAAQDPQLAKMVSEKVNAQLADPRAMAQYVSYQGTGDALYSSDEAMRFNRIAEAMGLTDRIGATLDRYDPNYAFSQKAFLEGLDSAYLIPLRQQLENQRAAREAPGQVLSQFPIDTSVAKQGTGGAAKSMTDKAKEGITDALTPKVPNANVPTVGVPQGPMNAPTHQAPTKTPQPGITQQINNVLKKLKPKW